MDGISNRSSFSCFAGCEILDDKRATVLCVGGLMVDAGGFIFCSSRVEWWM